MFRKRGGREARRGNDVLFARVRGRSAGRGGWYAKLQLVPLQTRSGGSIQARSFLTLGSSWSGAVIGQEVLVEHLPNPVSIGDLVLKKGSRIASARVSHCQR